MKKFKIFLTMFSAMFTLNFALAMEKNPKEEKNKTTTQETKKTEKENIFETEFVYNSPLEESDTLENIFENFDMFDFLNQNEKTEFSDISENLKKEFSDIGNLNKNFSPSLIENTQQRVKELELAKKKYTIKDSDNFKQRAKKMKKLKKIDSELQPLKDNLERLNWAFEGLKFHTNFFNQNFNKQEKENLEEDEKKIIEKQNDINNEVISKLQNILKPLKNYEKNSSQEEEEEFFENENLSPLEKCVQQVNKAFVKYYSEKNNFFKIYSENLNKAIKIIKEQNPNIKDEQIFDNEVLLNKLNYENTIENLKNMVKLAKNYSIVENIIKNNPKEEVEFAKKLVKAKLLRPNIFKKSFEKLQQDSEKENIIKIFREFEKFYNAYADVLNVFKKISKLKINKKEEKFEFLMQFYKDIFKETNILDNSVFEKFEKIYNDFYTVYSDFSPEIKEFFEDSTILNLSEKNAFNSKLGGTVEYSDLDNLIFLEQNEKKLDVYCALFSLINKKAEDKSKKYDDIEKNLATDLQNDELIEKFLNLKQLWETNKEFCDLKNDFENNFKKIAKSFSTKECKDNTIFIPKDFDFAKYQQAALNVLKLLKYKPFLSLDYFKEFNEYEIKDQDYFKNFRKEIAIFFTDIFKYVNLAITGVNSLINHINIFLENESKEKTIEKIFQLSKYDENKETNDFNLKYKNYMTTLKNLKNSSISYIPKFICDTEKYLGDYLKKKEDFEDEFKYNDNRIFLREKVKTILSYLNLVDNILAIEQLKNNVFFYAKSNAVVNKIKKHILQDNEGLNKYFEQIVNLSNVLKKLKDQKQMFLNCLK